MLLRPLLHTPARPRVVHRVALTRVPRIDLQQRDDVADQVGAVGQVDGLELRASVVDSFLKSCSAIRPAAVVRIVRWASDVQESADVERQAAGPGCNSSHGHREQQLGCSDEGGYSEYHGSEGLTGGAGDATAFVSAGHLSVARLAEDFADVWCSGFWGGSTVRVARSRVQLLFNQLVEIQGIQ